MSADTADDETKSAETNPGREAAAWRVKCREAEQQRDALASQVTAMRRTECERIAAEHLEIPADLFALSDIEMDSLLTDDGRVDAAKVESAALGLLKVRPGIGVTPSPPDMDGGARLTPARGGAVTYSDVLRGSSGQRRGVDMSYGQ